MTKVKSGFCIAASCAVIACSPVGVERQGTADDLFGTTQSGLPFLNYVYDMALAVALASEISDHCPTMYFSEQEEEKLIDELRKRMFADGVTPKQMGAINRNIDSNRAIRRRVNADEAAYVEKHGLDESKPETFCAAGRVEQRANSEVARFLKG